MAKNSSIEWTKHTLNLWWGCMEVHSGCSNCYAKIWAERWGLKLWGKNSIRRKIKSAFAEVYKFQREAEKAGEMHRVFVGSMMDIFEKPKGMFDENSKILVKDEDEFWNTGQLRDKFFNEVVPNCPNIMFLLLTKRPSNINKYIPESWKTNPPKNVMFGTSVVNQQTANDLIPQLYKVNGQRFLSIEPQLDEIDLTVKMKESDLRLIDTVDWIINGGESGRVKRPFNTDWGRVLRDQCKENGVPFFFKQVDKVISVPDDLKILEFPKYHTLKNNINMKNTVKTARSKEERLLINNQKCMLALSKGYKYDKATGEIIGQKGKAIKAHINGYKIISFVHKGIRIYLYGTTFIEYVLKGKNASITNEEIELAKVYVKPSAIYLATIRALKATRAKEAILTNDLTNKLFLAPLVNTTPKKHLHQGMNSSVGHYNAGQQF
jgi:protein gp37